MKRATGFSLILIALTFIATDCGKKTFPKNHTDIVGAWVEKTSNLDKTHIEFKSNSTLYLTKPSEPTDTFSFSLDHSDERLCLMNDAGRSCIKLVWNKKEDEITIYNLFASIPENPSITVFEKK